MKENKRAFITKHLALEQSTTKLANTHQELQKHKDDDSVSKEEKPKSRQKIFAIRESLSPPFLRRRIVDRRFAGCVEAKDGSETTSPMIVPAERIMAIGLIC
ncbi:hypothetical protein IGI04_040012 [Brassica rapa subsp. trilocularis]|uniref:TPX2 C-terminal domain-containing protein n=1 Tax=Brassica rapa subsp. trilocularis TaxID=1813537 RepID=A0ABQ7KPK4_BRACM|nr:hypothetical protein IGI04_040012 [Brassica rapa subsp. trilocularis]